MYTPTDTCTGWNHEGPSVTKGTAANILICDACFFEIPDGPTRTPDRRRYISVGTEKACSEECADALAFHG